jgi:hypothetical protein
MKKDFLNYGMSLMLSESQRRAIEDLSEKRETSLAEAARFVIDAGLNTLGIGSEP